MSGSMNEDDGKVDAKAFVMSSSSYDHQSCGMEMAKACLHMTKHMSAASAEQRARLFFISTLLHGVMAPCTSAVCFTQLKDGSVILGLIDGDKHVIPVCVLPPKAAMEKMCEEASGTPGVTYRALAERGTLPNLFGNTEAAEIAREAISEMSPSSEFDTDEWEGRMRQ